MRLNALNRINSLNSFGAKKGGVPWSSYCTSLAVSNLSDTSQKVAVTTSDDDFDLVSFEYSTDGVTFSEHGTSLTKTYDATELTVGTEYTWRARLKKGIKYSDYSIIDSGVPAIGLTNWRSAISNLDAGNNAIYNINFLGDSILEGNYLGTLSQIRSLSFPGLIRSYYATKYGNVGHGVIPLRHYFGLSQWSWDANWVAGNVGLNYYSKYTAVVGGTVTVAFKGTAVYLLASYRVQFDAVIDGGSVIHCSNGLGVDARKTLIASGLTDTEHSMTITWTYTGGSFMQVCGIYVTGGTKGIRCNNMGIAGTIIYYETQSASTLWARVTAPKLTIIATGTNEIVGSYSVTDYGTWLNTVIDNAQLDGDVLLVADNVLIDRTKAQQDPYVNKMLEVAAAQGVHVVNIYSKWNMQITELGYRYDDRHPNAAGHVAIYNEIMKVLK